MILILDSQNLIKSEGKYIETSQGIRPGGCLFGKRGEDVTADENISLNNGNLFVIDGVDNPIERIHCSEWTDGSIITLFALFSCSLKHMAVEQEEYRPLFLSGSTDFDMEPNFNISLMYINGTWHEISRFVA